MASIILYDGGVMGLFVKSLSVSTHSFQLIAVISVNILCFLFNSKKYFQLYRLNSLSIFLFHIFTLHYFFGTDFLNEYSVYKFELLAFNLLIFTGMIPVIYDFSNLRLLLGIIVLNVIIRLIFNYFLPDINNEDFILASDIQRNTYGEPIVYSRLVGFSIIIVLFHFKKIRKYLIPLMFIVLITIATRTILFVILLLLLYHFFLVNRSRFTIMKVMLIGFLSYLFLFYINEIEILFKGTRLYSLEGGGRLRMISDSFEMFQNSPFFGEGTGSFSKLHSSVSYFNRAYPHNLILELLGENGIIGLFLFVILLISIFYKISFHKDKKFVLFLGVYAFISCMTSLELPNQFLIFNLMIIVVFYKNIYYENSLSN